MPGVMHGMGQDQGTAGGELSMENPLRPNVPAGVHNSCFFLLLVHADA